MNRPNPCGTWPDCILDLVGIVLGLIQRMLDKMGVKRGYTTSTGPR